MSRRRWSGAGYWAVFLFYLAIALEVVIMITPFAAYFYSVYAPVLRFLEARPATAWLTAFFLPHVTYTGDPLLTVLAYLGPILLGLGLLAFLISAFQVYSAKLRKRGVVSRGLYRRVRHPQYLALAVAGLGLLLYWPRFIILVLFVTMLFVYYLLARHEEREMTRKHGDAYRAYAAALPMFVPWPRSLRGDPAGSEAGAVRRGAVALTFAVTLIAALAAAAALRSYSKAQLATVRDGNLLAVSLSGGKPQALQGRLASVLAHPDVARRLSEHPAAHGLVAYVLPQDYMMQHLLADLGEHEAHHGGGEDPGFLAALLAPLQHVAQMYGLKPRRQLDAGAASPRYRVIVTEAVRPHGLPAGVEHALDAGVLRFPLFFSDVEEGRVAMTMDTPPRHSWGTIPVPAF